MRVVGGMWKGLSLLCLADKNTTRPTTDRVKEALASMVLSTFDLDVSGVRVLDAYAGSGALGIELLSRGAHHVVFIDKDAKALKTLKTNLRSVKANEAQYTIVSGDTCMVCESRLSNPIGLVLLDPPYKTDPTDVLKVIEILKERKLLCEEAYVLYEHASGTKGLEASFLTEVKHKKYGDIVLDLYRVDLTANETKV